MPPIVQIPNIIGKSRVFAIATGCETNFFAAQAAAIRSLKPITTASAMIRRFGVCMSIRYYHPSLLFEVTARTATGAYFFDPVQYPEFGTAFNAIIATAQARHGIRVYAYFFMSNHYHAIYGADHADAMADFLCEVHGNVARYANRVLGRVGPVFRGRCDVMPIVPGDTTLPERVCYIMGQAIKVDAHWNLGNWPGANTNRALLYGEPLRGRRFDYHQKTLDQRLVAGPKADEAYTSEHQVTLAPLPCWAHLPEAELRAKYQAVGHAAAEKYGCTKGGTIQKAEIATDCSVAATVGQSTDGPAQSRPPALTEHQKAIMQMGRPEPRKRENNNRRPVAYADSEQEVARYRKAYERICEQHARAREELAEQTALLLRGETAKAVKFPMYTFGAVVRTGELVHLLGLSTTLENLT